MQRRRNDVIGLRAALSGVLLWAGHGPSFGAEAGDAVRGERAFQRCYACHSVDPAETARLQGPSLHGVLGRPAAAVSGFEYSDAMRDRSKAGLTWTAERLDAFLANPEAAVPGTSMSALPIGDPLERADIIAYLGSLGNQGR
jgi:cytochrome c